MFYVYELIDPNGLIKYINKFDPEQLEIGYQTETEHQRNDVLNVIQNDGDILKICITHLLEQPNYYTKLKQIEGNITNNEI